MIQDKEKRRHERYELALEARVLNPDSGAENEVRIGNISRGGAYFVAAFQLSVGDWVELQLGSGVFIAAEVIRANPLFDDTFGYAVRFARASDHTGVLAEANVTVSRGTELFQLELKPLNEMAFEYYPRLERVRDYVDENLTEGITLEQAAGVAAMEKTYFSSFFHQKVGVTFSAWLQYLRVAKALEMIRKKDHSIAEVAFAVGFNELSTFQKAFKRWTSLTPRDYKKLARPA